MKITQDSLTGKLLSQMDAEENPTTAEYHNAIANFVANDLAADMHALRKGHGIHRIIKS